MAFVDRDFMACLTCAQDCFFRHARNAIGRPHIAPSFLVPLQDSSLLRIPRQFSASFLGKCLGQAQLEGPTGKLWCAEMKREQHCMSFANPGWSAFVEDLNLQIGDGLLITYLGRNIFKVRIFDMEGLEKGSQCPFEAYNTRKEQPPVKMDRNILVYDDVGPHDDHEENKISNEYNAKQDLENFPLAASKHLDKDSQNVSRMSIVVDLCDQGVLSENSLGIHCIGKRLRRFEANGQSSGDPAFCEAGNAKQGNGGITCANCEDMLITTHFGDGKQDLMTTQHEAYQSTDCELPLVDEKNCHFSEELQETAIPKTARRLSKLEAIDSCDKQNIISHRRTWGSPLQERQNVSEMVQWRLICEANAFKSPFPIARKSLKPSYDHKMILPKLFVEKFMPKKVASLTLTDPQGDNWPCKWLGAIKGSHQFAPCISAGWSQFTHAHQLKINDILVFELIEQQSLHFKVHIFKPQAFDILSHPPFLLSSPPSIYETKYHSEFCE